MADLQNAAELIQYIERIETVEDEIRDLTDARKDVYAELKAQGYHTKFVRALVALRAIDPEKRKENDALMSMYREAAGLA